MSIKLRATLVTAIFLACVSLALSVLALSLQRTLLTIEAKRKVEVAVSMLSDMSSNALQSGDLLALAIIADRAAKGQPTRAAIADRYGQILADSEHKDYDQTNAAIQLALKSGRQVIARSSHLFEAASPVVDYAGRTIGVVYITFSAAPLEKELALLSNAVAGFALISIILGGIVAYVFARYLGSLFTPMLQAIRRTAGGDLGAQVPRAGVAELDEVGRAFNRMASTIEKRVRDLERLNQMSTELSSAITVEDFAASVCNTLASFSSADCRLVLSDPVTGSLTMVGEKNELGRPAPNSAVAIAARERRAITIGLKGDLGPGSEIAPGINRDAAIVAPLATPTGEMLGAVLVTYDWRELQTPQKEDVTSVWVIANYAAPALAALRRSQTQERIADALKDMLIPDHPPEIEGFEAYTRYEPADESVGFGGDYYDFLDMEGGRWGIAIGDVSGKGLEAGRYTSMVKYVVRSFALERRTPGEAMSRANAALAAQMGDVMFVTVFLGILDTQKRTFTYSSAGHPPGLLLRRNTETRELSIGGGVMGIEGFSRFEQGTVELEPGDLIVLYTDGVLEARRDKELYGPDRLQAVLEYHAQKPLNDIAEAVIASVRDYTQAPLQDDIALVLLRAKEGDVGVE